MTTTASTPRISKQSIATQPTRLIKVALIDLYNGEANLGIQAIKDLVTEWRVHSPDLTVELHHFDTRKTGIAPDLEFDLYISSGGPGSPFDGEGTAWEAAYFKWVDSVWHYNRSHAVKSGDLSPKHVLFICHSFQMMCRHFDVGHVIARRSQSFGIFKIHMTTTGQRGPLFKGLHNPFYAADFREWQVVQPKKDKIKSLGGAILAYEKNRPHVQLEPAVMGLRISKEMVGVQFHPEANPAGMLVHFQKDKRRMEIINKHGEAKFNQIIQRLKDPKYLLQTHQTVVPNFLRNAIAV